MLRASKTCQVWEAIHDLDNRKVVIKTLRENYIRDKEEINSLKHEFTVAGKFDHPFVIHVYEFDTFRGVAYLVLEFAFSRNMKMAIREGVEELAYWTPKIIEEGAKSLGYMHEQGWVHCDVKPDNFLLDTEGNLKLIDFSIAQKKKSGLGKLFGGGSKVKGNVQGTRSYMSPEQIRGAALDDRADIYSFGCTIFELISGKLPYTATSPDHLLDKHLRGGIPSLQAATDNITPEFSSLVERLMAKDPKQRPDTMSDVVRLLKNIKIYKIPPRKPSGSVEPDKATATSGDDTTSTQEEA
ncbi:serine/threonine protein kinase [Blastopirellula marina]|uniref:mitogen-activated protein kinase kinase n=2 Tax=Pirellulales TaxID=2691354 RepID=A0A2S8FAM7_9BACT|nr:serine/threonine protein kinase [Blastopirellula marina]RCS50408.1 serine/threonine protein kinase [Bremerella cremea]